MKTQQVTYSSKFALNKKNIRNISSTISPVQYYIPEGFTGKGVRIAIIDSGCPKHKDIPIAGKEHEFEYNNVSFCDDSISPWDKYGHSTMISGVISASNKKAILGVAPQARLLHAKVVNDRGQCSFNSMVAAVLWAIVRKVDVIAIALGTQYDHSVLHDAILKARKENICVFAAAGEEVKNKDGELDYPARYPEVFSAGFLTRGKVKSAIIKSKVDLYTTNKGLSTTYLDNQYVKAYGSSVSTAYFAGLAAVLIEKYKKTIPKYEIPPLVYSTLTKSLI